MGGAASRQRECERVGSVAEGVYRALWGVFGRCRREPLPRAPPWHLRAAPPRRCSCGAGNAMRDGGGRCAGGLTAARLPRDGLRIPPPPRGRRSTPRYTPSLPRDAERALAIGCRPRSRRPIQIKSERPSAGRDDRCGGCALCSPPSTSSGNVGPPLWAGRSVRAVRASRSICCMRLAAESACTSCALRA